MTMPSELLDMNCRQLQDRIAASEIKSVVATEVVFEAIEKYEPTLGAYISTFEEQALRDTNEVDSKTATGKPVGNLAEQT